MSHLKQLLELFQDQRLLLPPGGDSEQWAKSLDVFLGEWSRWNDKVNLTSEHQATAVINRHIFDSLQYGRVMDSSRINVMDIGSGAGFPGIPIKIIFPDIFIVLVESQRKRANFLKNCVRKIGLQKIEVVNQRAEELTSEFHGRFDLILFRGVGEISECLKMAQPFLATKGIVVIKKGTGAISPKSTGGVTNNFSLREEIPLEGWKGVASKLMVFDRCFT